jgi:hypothetical protein
VRSFFGTGEEIEFVTEVEKPPREASEFAAGLVILQLTAKQLQKMPRSGDGVVNSDRATRGHPPFPLPN